MSYIDEFSKLIKQRDLVKMVGLWEEYCANDVVDIEELLVIMKNIRESEMAGPFGRFAEQGLHLWKIVENPNERYQILKAILDLQTSNSDLLADLAFESLKERYSHHPEFNERIRLVGLRGQKEFQGALSNYELLAHMQKGNYVFHIGGWDVGEIIEVSPVLEQMSVEFEFVSGHKHFTFQNAFKTLRPLPKEHFLSCRFANPDKMEQAARENPIALMHQLLRDLGPQTAAEIKEELCELVIPEKDWSKWWQWTRSKLKKDPFVETPQNIRQPFTLRREEISTQELLDGALEAESSPNELLQKCYSLVRDQPTVTKDPAAKEFVKKKVLSLLNQASKNNALLVQIIIFFENSFNESVEGYDLKELIQKFDNFKKLIEEIPILAFKKKLLVAIHDGRSDWVQQFLDLMLFLEHGPLRDYILKELNVPESKAALTDKINELLQNPMLAPEVFVWYFQKLVTKEGKNLPFSDKESLSVFFETFLILYNILELRPEWRDLLKKMYNILSGKRFAVVRQLLDGSSIEFAKEYLLLVSKCQTLSDHDVKIMRSLAEVVHPSLGKQKKKKSHALFDGNIIWTTEEGYRKTKERIEAIGNVEIVENAREIEQARSHGDLRENSEYKFALEKRTHLQSQLKMLSDQLNRARIITKDDINPHEVGIGSKATVKNLSSGEVNSYHILGPWDANPTEGILSFQSQLAQAMIGVKKGEKFRFKNDEYLLVDLSS